MHCDAFHINNMNSCQKNVGNNDISIYCSRMNVSSGALQDVIVVIVFRPCKSALPLVFCP